MSEEIEKKSKDICMEKVVYSDDAELGVDYLGKIDYKDREAAKVFFFFAKEKGKTIFYDDSFRKFSLSHQDDGGYLLERL